MSKRVLLPGAVRAIRKAKEATDERFKLGRFAVACHTTPGHLCNFEMGRKVASADLVERIAEQLGVSLDAISYEITTEAAA